MNTYEMDPHEEVNTGFYTSRWPENPKERMIAEKWIEWCRLADPHNPFRFVSDLLYSGNGLVASASENEAHIVATVIQWLGTPVGQEFVRSCVVNHWKALT